jgi:hypothetical protein
MNFPAISVSSVALHCYPAGFCFFSNIFGCLFALRALRLCARSAFCSHFFVIFASFAVEIPDLSNGIARSSFIIHAIRAIRGSFLFGCGSAALSLCAFAFKSAVVE